MKLANFKREDIKKYFAKNKLNKNITLSEFEYCLYFISKNWKRYEEAKEKQSLTPIKFTYKGKQTAFYEQVLNLIFLKTLEQTASNGLRKICKAKIKEVDKKWLTISANSNQLKKENDVFKAAIKYTLEKSGMPIKRKTGYNKKWQEFVVTEHLNQPELIELQMFLMNTDHVLVQAGMVVKNKQLQEKEQSQKARKISSQFKSDIVLKDKKEEYEIRKDNLKEK